MYEKKINGVMEAGEVLGVIRKKEGLRISLLL